MSPVKVRRVSRTAVVITMTLAAGTSALLAILAIVVMLVVAVVGAR